MTDLRFNGPDYVPKRDKSRLTRQHNIIMELMSDGVFRTLRTIELYTNQPQASISAQLRHLRKARFGSHTVNKRHISNGIFEYQLILNKP